MKLKLIDEDWIDEKLKELYENKNKEKSNLIIKALIGVKLHLKSPIEEIKEAYEAGFEQCCDMWREAEGVAPFKSFKRDGDVKTEDYLKQKGYDK